MVDTATSHQDPPMKQRLRSFSVWMLFGIVVHACPVRAATGQASGVPAEGSPDCRFLSSLCDHSNVVSGSERLRRSPGLAQLGNLASVFSEAIHPAFDSDTPRNVTTQLGQTVYLHCIVHNLGDKMVSWIRRRDFHVLTVGLTTYTTDDRFQAVHVERSNDWMLQIKLAQLGDAGLYECQVNTHPLISYFVHLNVLVPKATIREAPDLYVKTGSTINLTCDINQSPEPPVFVFWYHNERMINYDPSRGDISVQKTGNYTSSSTLSIRNAQPADSGNYTCGPSNAEPTSISVHVLNGEKRAAMQHDLGTSVNSVSTSFHQRAVRPCPVIAVLVLLKSLDWS